MAGDFEETAQPVVHRSGSALHEWLPLKAPLPRKLLYINIAPLCAFLFLGCEPAAPPKAETFEDIAKMVLPAVPKISWFELQVPGERKSSGSGKALFGRYCAPCHGEDGKGQGMYAQFLHTPPADLSKAIYKFKSTLGDSPPQPSDLFRTISVGIASAAMPAFAHLLASDRWALVEHVQELGALKIEIEDRNTQQTAQPAPNKAAPQGDEAYRELGCHRCHGEEGRGDGTSAAALKQHVPDWWLGPGIFKAGSSPEAIFRTLQVGLGASAMPSYADSAPDKLWRVAGYVASLTQRGYEENLAAWRDGLAKLGLLEVAPQQRPIPLSFWERLKNTLSPPGGCTDCHQVATINDKMQPALLAMAGGHADKACTLCHQGQARGSSIKEAHRGMIPDPGSLWVVGLGLSCGQCHAERGGLSSMHGSPLPNPVGGRLMHATSKASDPSGAVGSAHAYRVPRGLMAAELGKANKIRKAMADVPEHHGFLADMPNDDPDGQVPIVGSADYRRWVAEAIEGEYLKPLARVESVPDTPGTAPFRKLCFRCHLWDRGTPGAGGRHRAEGCSACHVVYDKDARAGPDGRVHAIEHRITTRVRSEQCAHCHWSGNQSQFGDLHHFRGMDCIDCHTSIDLHGDGNIYTTMHRAVEVACADCHGTKQALPWELPVGYGTPVTLKGSRGTMEVEHEHYLLSSRGNALGNVYKRGHKVEIKLLNGELREVPLLKDGPLLGNRISQSGQLMGQAAHTLHDDRLACASCHVTRTVRCLGCHLETREQGQQQDFIASALYRSSPLQRAQIRMTPGRSRFAPSDRAQVEPVIIRDQSGRFIPTLPGCGISPVQGGAGRGSTAT